MNFISWLFYTVGRGEERRGEGRERRGGQVRGGEARADRQSSFPQVQHHLGRKE